MEKRFDPWLEEFDDSAEKLRLQIENPELFSPLLFLLSLLVVLVILLCLWGAVRVKLSSRHQQSTIDFKREQP